MARRRPANIDPNQLRLFEELHAPSPRREDHVGPAAITDEDRAVASALPARVFLGTSSWTFPGWHGIVYDRQTTVRTLSNDGLGAYAKHPLLRAAGIDRTYYAPIRASEFARYAASVPDEFRFLVKAHELCTIDAFNARNRYGRSRGEANVAFFDAVYATEQVVAPMVEGLGTKAGPLVFQLAPLNVRRLGGPGAFAERLRVFLHRLPRGPLYAIELRNRELLTEAYLDALGESGAAHCYNAHPSMPVVEEQLRAAPPERGPAVVVRWMLNRKIRYEEAREQYAPFDRIVDEDAENREAIAAMARLAATAEKDVYVIANNKAEGSAPLSIFRLARAIVS
jgi:uncharacterized protein YecE (DUF72 family)